MAERFPNVHRSDDDLFSEDLYKRIEQLVETLREDPLGIIITGRSGTGKSELLAALMGLNEERKENSSSSESDSDNDSDESESTDSNTHQILENTFTKDSIKVTVWDCPGLQDGVNDEEEYLKKLKEKCGNNADLMLYCIDMSQRRFADEFAVHNSAVEKITHTLGRDIWSRTLVVLTKGNILAKGLEKKNTKNIEEEFNITVREWKERFMEALHKANVDKNVVKKIEVQPAGFYTGLHLPGRDHWLSNLWSYVFTTADPDAQAKIMLLNASRLQDTSTFDEQQSSESAQWHTSIEQSIVLTDNVMSAIIDSNVPRGPTETTTSAPGPRQLFSPPHGQLVQKPLTPNVHSSDHDDHKSSDTNKKQSHIPTTFMGALLGLRKGVGLSLLVNFLKTRVQSALTWKEKVDLRDPCNEAQV